MKRYLSRTIYLLIFILSALTVFAQAPDAAYVKALYKSYPTQKSDHCASCKLWVNPYFRSIADTLQHTPILTFYIYTRAHRLEQEALDLPRTGVYAGWHAAYGQPDEGKVYREANRRIGRPNSAEMVAKGHCQPWILMAWSSDAAILSNTYTFNAGMEFQGQNVGTQLATEELCRELTGHKSEAVTDSVLIWCGTYGSSKVYTKDRISVTVPSHYYKIIRYLDLKNASVVTLCYWMPNDPLEKKTFTDHRLVDFESLIQNIGFDPTLIFNK